MYLSMGRPTTVPFVSPARPQPFVLVRLYSILVLSLSPSLFPFTK